MDTQKLIARLRERAATQDACGCWSLDRAVADELERLAREVALLRADAVSDGESIADLIEQNRALRARDAARKLAIDARAE